MRQRNSSVLLFLLLSTTSLVACDDRPGSGAVTAETAEADCRAYCEHDLACDEDTTETLAECTAECVAEVTGWVRGDALAAYADCVVDLACDQNDAVCLATCEPLDAHAAYETACRAGLAGCLDASEVAEICDVAPAGTEGDVGTMCLLAPEIVDELTACFDGGAACQVALDCLDAVGEAHGVDL